MTAAGSGSVAVELAQLRGEIGTGLAEIKGALGVLVERIARTDADLKQLRTDTEESIRALQQEIDELKRGRWPLAQIGSLLAVGALAVAVVALFIST
ncbi:hypothetical protein OG292_16540 [Streptomyces sp. NBC_01511]|uniref:hypothetical protein n=1 Tax=unclassified Streptomyces TaxID=2593676 RepID=UPI0038696051